MYESSIFGGIFWLFWLALYIYYAGCQYAIANKTGHKYPWWSFVPVLNLYQTVEMAGKPWYWFVFYFIPFINLAAYALIWVEIAKARQKEAFWGVLMLLPFINLIALFVMASGPMPQPQQSFEKKPDTVREPADII